MNITDISTIPDGPLVGYFHFTFSEDDCFSPPVRISARHCTKAMPNILILSEDLTYYLAKCHQSFFTGLQACFNVAYYDPSHTSFFRKPSLKKVLKKFTGDKYPDIILDFCTIDGKTGAFVPSFNDVGEFDGIYCARIGDFWEIKPRFLQNFISSIINYNVDYLLSYFPHPLFFLKDTPLENKILYLPPNFDPTLFKDWGETKRYDIGFLAAGTSSPSPFYPERLKLHQQLCGRSDIVYLHAPHPATDGTYHMKKAHPLMGVGFSKHINQCKCFVNTGGIYRTPNARTIEILASKSCLVAYEHFDCGALHLVDGFNYIRISDGNAMDKIMYYISHTEECERIAENGYNTALQYHTGDVRAYEFKKLLFADDDGGALNKSITIK
jgi:hypothetical protein